jgi:formate dehydrogenase subunit gamma
MSKKDSTITVRFVLSQRIEHILLMISFSMLCLTGLPQRYIGAGWAQGILGVFGGLQAARTIHHFFAIMLIAETLYHAIIIACELIFARPRRIGMLPRWQDVRDGFASVGYLLGLRKDKPRYDRFDFKQKVEYWAMIWGTVVMGLSGLILLFPIEATRFLPGVFLPAAKVVHSYEAVLAFLAIITWHFYNSHLAEGAFPMDAFSIFTGKTTLKRMEEEHPLEYERLAAGKNAATGSDGAEK